MCLRPFLHVVDAGAERIIVDLRRLDLSICRITWDSLDRSVPACCAAFARAKTRIHSTDPKPLPAAAFP